MKKYAMRMALCLVFGSAFFSGRIARSQSFSLSATPVAITIHPGDQQVAVTVTATSSNYSGPVNITLTGLPSGITVTPLSIAPGASGVIYLNASRSADQEDFSPRVNGLVTSPVRTVLVTGAAGTAVVTTPISLVVTLSNPAFLPAAGNINLPVVNIDTSGVAIADKVTDVPGTITIVSADGQTSYLPNAKDADNTATFHLHGNSTLNMPKKAYHVKLNTSDDLLTAMGLSCPYVTSSGKPICDKSKSYILLANYDDKTFLRDWSALALANAIPMGGDYLSPPAGSPTPSGTSALMPWAAHSLFVELYLNGEYEGNYELTEQVKADKNRVNISELSESDVSDDITGGYLLEIVKAPDDEFNFTTPKGVAISLDDPDYSPDPAVPSQTAYISNYVDTAENAMFSGQFTDPTLGWRAYFDETSLINFYIVNDLMGNVDGGAFNGSDYFYKAIDNPLLYMGPVWDFDISSGNVNYFPIVDPTIEWTQNDVWYSKLFSDRAFLADLTTQWNALKNNGVLASWLSSIQAESAALEQSQANNFGRWPMQGIEVWPNPQAAGSYDGEVNYMLAWLNLRMAWIDSRLNNKKKDSITLTVPAGPLRNGVSSSFSAQVAAVAAPAGNVTFLSNGVILGNSPVDLNGNANFSAANLPAGVDTIEAIYSGDSVNAVTLSATQTMTVSALLSTTITSVAAIANGFGASVIANSGTAVPTGTVTFTVNNGAGVTVSLDVSGHATYTPGQLDLPVAMVAAAYSGDANYLASTATLVLVPVATPVFSPQAGTYTSVQSVAITDSNLGAAIYFTTDGSTPTTSSTLYSTAINVASSETIQAIAVAPGFLNSAVASAAYAINLPPDFALSVSPSSLTISRGGSGTATASVSPLNSFGAAVTFSCSGLPTGVTCSFSPASVTPSGSAATTTVTIASTTSAQAARPVNPFFPGASLAFAVCWIGWKKRRSLAGIAAACVLIATLSGCGSSSPKPTIATVTISAAAGSLRHNATLTLTVQ